MSAETGISRQADDPQLALAAEHEGLSGPQAIFQKSSLMPAAIKRLADKVVIADRGATGRHKDVGAFGLADGADGRVKLVGNDAEIARLRRQSGGQRLQARNCSRRRSGRAAACRRRATSSSPVVKSDTAGLRA